MDKSERQKRDSRQVSAGHPVAGLRFACLTVMICLAFAACAAQSTVRKALGCSSGAGAAPRQITILAQQVGLYAPKDVAWSPTGTCIALLGEHRAQVHAPSDGIAIAIYNAASGALVNQFHPTGTILATLTPRPTGTLIVNATHILWSPGGQQLAFTFLATSQDYVPLFRGLVVTDVTARQLQVLFEPVTSSTPPIVEWDLTTGKPIPLSLAPALGYHWASGGALVADTTLNAFTAPAAPSLGPIGNPDGGSAFTIWQPGVAQVSASFGNLPAVSGVSGWSTNFAAWSPDGRYLVDDISIQAGVVSGDHSIPAGSGPGRVPLLPVRDAGLQAVYNTMTPSAPSGLYSQRVAWRPDGRMLAVRPLLIQPQDGLNHGIHLYDCASGASRATLPPFTQSGDVVGTLFLARWSPDGSRLLLYDDDTVGPQGIITIWGSSALPA